MGLDRLSIVALGLGLVLAGCENGGSPSAARRLLYGEPAQELTAVPGSVIAIGRVFDAATLGRRFTSCSPGGAVDGAVVVERIGVFGESLTFADDAGKTLYSCDGGTDPRTPTALVRGLLGTAPARPPPRPAARHSLS